ncbi:MAG: 4-(cytidine 5'-diphospho)-2-C-methyl-D-erythritol kinase [Deltaproteobacteria bacterium]|nr:4-(cytidine 5'-diphospho)-2-C-methyl-D-erythritol kinase [Deltaproteobacteria bacterium]
MEAIKLLAPAKVNLILQVLRKRSDGYHEILSLMQRLSWGDEVLLRKRVKGVLLKVAPSVVPSNRENLAYRAAEYFFERFKIDGGVEIELQKRIPVGAGLGGGSSDAAAVLRGLASLWGIPLDLSPQKIARELGADLPFFLGGSPAIARGIGEELEPIDKFPSLWYLLAFSKIFVSTAQAYGALRLTKEREPVTLPQIYHGMSDLKSYIINDFEPWVTEQWPELKEMKEQLRHCGAEIAGMSGSGSTFFGLFSSEETAKKAQEALSKEGIRDTIVAQGEISPSPLLPLPKGERVGVRGSI